MFYVQFTGLSLYVRIRSVFGAESWEGIINASDFSGLIWIIWHNIFRCLIGATPFIKFLHFPVTLMFEAT